MQVMLDEVPGDPLPAEGFRFARIRVSIGKAHFQIGNRPARQRRGNDIPGPAESLHQLGGGSAWLVIIIPRAQSLELISSLSQRVAKPASARSDDVPGNEIHRAEMRCRRPGQLLG